MPKVLILGGHGDGLVAAQVLRDMQRSGQDIELAGFLNDRIPKGGEISSIPVLGTIPEWEAFPLDTMFHIALHKVGHMRARVDLIESLGIPANRLASLVHPSAQIADDVQIGAGALIASYVTCQPGVSVGIGATVRAGANLGHDVHIADFAYVGPNATLCGRATTGKGSHVAPGAIVVDGVSLADFALLGAGGVAFRPMGEDEVWMGNPARKVK
ncbi:hypothetical protein ACH58_23345 [Achromobacter xylosoxidans]|uniref:hypothetical protein n=1 Tax=Alcaligenes xylosoxydans xylosoxydans TaxID=85698 RepID=UPI00065CEEC8|nr:hypothetical protein [Achromobacter xylosoxidans]KMJ88303.1 hypothetical protein ACH58_23345 [Achromobacter xylosoxidans]